VTREELQAELWGARDTGTRALDTVIKRLRRKLGGTRMRLSTIRGAGFRLETEGGGVGAEGAEEGEG
jgi:DNA-binding response OmpR family regulator